MHRPISANVKDRKLVHERRRRLVRAALTAFTRKGYHGATVREIGRAAGFTQGTIYNYVRSKGDILYLVCDDKVRAHQEAVARAVEGIRDPALRVSTALHILVEAMHDHQETVLLVTGRATRSTGARSTPSWRAWRSSSTCSSASSSRPPGAAR
jgi:AcrR family transcriptional regulator